MSLFFQCATLFLLSFLTQCHCYIITPLSQIHQVRRISSSIVFSSLSRDGDDHFDYRDHREQNDGVSLSYSILSRRHALGSLAAIGGSISSSATCPILSARAAAAIEQEQRTQDKEQTAVINVNCLADLPPIPAGFVRVYLCRHGQTENNRLNLMQGARVDPAINDTGMAQAERLGMALANADVVPDLILHSKLQRSRQTANIASLQFTKHPKLATLATLGEVDFGEVAEGLPVEQVRSQLVATYAGWATGNLDMSMPGGETGRQVRT
jgi:Histidine phosphatase superfamily (branch 1)